MALLRGPLKGRKVSPKVKQLMQLSARLNMATTCQTFLWGRGPKFGTPLLGRN